MNIRMMIPVCALTVVSLLPVTSLRTEAASNAAIPFLAAPEAVSPIGVSKTAAPVYTWKAVAGAEAYDLVPYGTLLRSVTAADAGCATTPTCTYAFPTALPDGGKYSWFVRAKKSKGAAGPFSAALTFDVATTPTGAWQLLKSGNADYVAGNWKSVIRMSTANYRLDAVNNGQRPYAIVLTCSDSRVPPEVLFDKGLGEIFVIRVAGNVVAPHELGSIEYALEHLKSKLIVVLGHEKCGAVQAAHDLFEKDCLLTTPANICSLVASINPAVAIAAAGVDYGSLSAAQQVEECVLQNIRLVAENLKLQSPVIEEAVAAGKAAIVKAKYDLHSGVVTEITE